MNVLLVQPPEQAPPVAPVSFSGKHLPLFAPPWNLLCLRSYLLERTRHLATVIDCRTFTELESELVRAIEAVPEPRILVVETSSQALGQATAVVELARRSYPGIRTVLCGEFPSQFPGDVAALTHVDFALAGDPEPILRNLLDYMDLPQRLRRVPGLIIDGSPPPSPYWLPKLRELALPDWNGIHWSAYETEWPTPTLRAEARLSRGHTRTPADRAFGNAQEPFRLWPLDMLAKAIQRCASLGITEVLICDAPGVWTPERLNEWCAALRNVRNTQPWGLRLLPTLLSDDTVSTLEFVVCRRVDMIFPSADPDLLKHYGCIMTPAQIAATIRRLQSFGITVHGHFWVGGPEERRGERERVARFMRQLGYLAASLHAFPFHLDAPLYREVAESAPAPHLEDWIRWSRDPWMVERPVALWGGQPAIAEVQKALADIRRTVTRSPRHLALKLAALLRSRNWIKVMEDTALGLVPPPMSKP